MFDTAYCLLFTLFVIVLSSNEKSATLGKHENNFIKLLTVLGNNYIKFKSDPVKVKFWTCVERAGDSVKKYARCLIKLLNSKNFTQESRKSGDNLISHDLELVKSFQKRPVQKNSFQLLHPRVNDHEIRNSTTKNRISLPELIDSVVSMHKSVNDGVDQSSKIMRYVSNFFKFLSDRYPKSQESISNFRLLSPRFLSTEPDTSSRSRYLSPDFFDLHNNASQHSILSLSKLLKEIPNDESSMWWRFINETLSSVKNDVIRATWNNSISKIYGEYKLGNATIRNRVKRFYDTLDEWQLNDLNAKGYTMLKDYQLNEIQHNKKYKYNLNSGAVIQKALGEAVLNLARGRSDHRGKRALAKGCLLKASVGSEEAYSNYIVSHIILCPSAVGYYAFGSLVLTPFILSPYVLAPFLLSTFVFMPFILSPAALSPTILAPGVLSPSLLNPVVLSPFLLSPLVLSPTILGPFCLSPIILSPSVLSPVALSPDVLSPVVLSPCAGC
uniref:Uncharacterized protein n=1 Tax=Romanomermis culicivorax TaxID=13658 RepID=A0A915INU0_ROMCU